MKKILSYLGVVYLNKSDILQHTELIQLIGCVNQFDKQVFLQHKSDILQHIELIQLVGFANQFDKQVF